MTPRRPGAHARGTTLIEMMVVLAIVGILAAAAHPMLELAARRQKEVALREALRQIRGAIDAHKQAADTGRIPKEADASGYPGSLAVLVDGVAETASADAFADSPSARSAARRTYFLRRLPRDPFADARLPAAETWALRASTSPPRDPQPGRDVFDVASRSTATALDGSRYRDW